MSTGRPNETRIAAARWLPEIVRRRPKSTIAAIIVVILLGLHFGPLLNTHAEQDACSFGPVTNERYHELLAAAKRRPNTIWPSHVWDTKKLNTQLNERFDQLSRGMTSVYERLAAMHALVRAFGGEYRRTLAGISDPYPKAIQGGGVVFFSYYVDLNRHFYFSPFQRYLLLGGYLAVNDNVSGVRDPSRTRLGDIQFAAKYPMIGKDSGRIPRSPFGEICPVVPDAALAALLRRSEN